ncbi:MAG: transketolase [Reyranella sp.]|nr:transketolase [Reyranella sp.]
MTPYSHKRATQIEGDLRAARLRLLILRTHAAAGAGHLGSSLSIVEILSALYSSNLHHAAQDSAQGGDRVVLSKGHAALGLYCALAEEGIIPHAALRTFGQNGSELEPHPNETLLPQVAVSTGSLGQGLSIGLGLAHGSRLAGRDEERTAVVLGDGELNEGQPWEAAIAAPRLRLGNLLAVVDANGLQQDGTMEDIMPVNGLADAWAALGWQVHSANGHDYHELLGLFTALRKEDPAKPKLVIARTIKGCGVPFLENAVESHYPPVLDAGEIDLVARMIISAGSDDA